MRPPRLKAVQSSKRGVDVELIADLIQPSSHSICETITRSIARPHKGCMVVEEML